MNGFFANIKNKLANFAYGRYGIDKLYYALMVVWLIILIANMFVQNQLASLIMTLVSTALLVYMIWRSFSRNYTARSKENDAYLRLTAGPRKWFTLQGRRFKDRKTHRYVKCKHCRSLMRLPYKKGTHTALCPKCGQKFQVKL